jgi:hypothetical protein
MSGPGAPVQELFWELFSKVLPSLSVLEVLLNLASC